MNKKISVILLGICVFFGFAGDINAEEEVRIDFFYSSTCSHCAKEKVFLEGLADEDENIFLYEYEISDSNALSILLGKYTAYSVEEEYRGHIPIVFIKDEYFIGFDEENTPDYIKGYIYQQEGGSDSVENTSDIDIKRIKIPLIGEVDLSNAQPLVLSSIFGILDGFNACAMAALTFLLAILISTGKRERVVLVGGVFILVSGIVYFLFISAWMNIFLIIENVKAITLAIGIIIFLFGIYMVKDYFSGAICKLCEFNTEKQNFFSRMQAKLLTKMKELISSEAPLVWTILGVAGVAAGINTVELICSFGLPVAFTKILVSYNLSTVVYYLNLFVYVFFYMLDDFIIFLIAVFTLRISEKSQGYLKIVTLFSGILLLILGLVIIFFPEMLGML